MKIKPLQNCISNERSKKSMRKWKDDISFQLDLRKSKGCFIMQRGVPLREGGRQKGREMKGVGSEDEKWKESVLTYEGKVFLLKWTHEEWDSTTFQLKE